jgi:signal transduction histidine kinase
MGDAPVRRITIRARKLDSFSRVEVEDSGPGVPAQLQERIFDPYVRGAESTTPGLGLGLATVRRLAEAHGGAAGLRGDLPSGSLFWFELPTAPETATGRTAAARTPRASRVRAT